MRLVHVAGREYRADDGERPVCRVLRTDDDRGWYAMDEHGQVYREATTPEAAVDNFRAGIRWHRSDSRAYAKS